MVIDRPLARHRIRQSFRVHPAVALLGARQCGKSTLARMIAEDEPAATFFDLNGPSTGVGWKLPKRRSRPLKGWW